MNSKVYKITERYAGSGGFPNGLTQVYITESDERLRAAPSNKLIQLTVQEGTVEWEPERVQEWRWVDV